MKFCGIFFSVYNEIGERHHLKHFSVTYGEYEASFDINTGELIIGYLPPAQMRKVRKKIKKKEIREKLLNCWDELNKENVTNSKIKVYL